MTELKTLRDILGEALPGELLDANPDTIIHAFVERLKREGIKHIKNIEQYKAEHTINFIKHFFNISEEELK
jgi:hypothetical protein